MQRRFAPRNNFRKFTADTKTADKILLSVRVTQALAQTTDNQADLPFIPKHAFSDFEISEILKTNIVRKNYLSPTPIQDASIPEILQGKDIIGIANTGTGKTAAYLIPLIEKVLRNRLEKVLIVCPTRELANQIDDEFYSFAKGTGIFSTVLIGQVSLNRQRSDLRRNPNFVIGTPGRIKDLVNQGALSLSRFQSVVLDETDRMVDIGFVNDIKFFISLLPANRQSLFFSATVPPKAKEILSSFVKNALTISVKKKETIDNIHQDVVRVGDRTKKVDLLHDLLIQEGFDKVLIFSRTKWNVQKLADELMDRGFKVGAIHGNKRQSQRQRVLDAFKRDEIKILLATDIASRGLDIEGVSHVINYDLPSTFEDYVHRIGRTGRINKKGIALTFIEQ